MARPNDSSSSTDGIEIPDGGGQSVLDNMQQAIRALQSNFTGGATPPTDPVEGQLWYDESLTDPRLKIYNGTGFAILPFDPNQDSAVIGTVSELSTASLAGISDLDISGDVEPDAGVTPGSFASTQAIRNYVDGTDSDQHNKDNLIHGLTGSNSNKVVGTEETQTLTNKTIDVDNNTVSNIEVDNLKSGVLDTDISTTSSSDDTLPSAKAVKTYVDAQVTAQDLDITGDTGTIAIDLDSETLDIEGGTGITSTASGSKVSLAIDSTVATKTGSETFTNKTFTSPDINTPDIDGGTIDNTTIGVTTATTGKFTTLESTGASTLNSLGVTGAATVGGKLTVTGDLQVDGTTTSINSTIHTTNDKAIALANNVTTLAGVDGAGILLGSNSVESWTYDNTNSHWETKGKPVSATAFKVGTTTVIDTSGEIAATKISAGALGSDVKVKNDNWSGTDLSVANGGTGVSTLTNAGILIGNGTGGVRATARPTDGQMLVGSAGTSADPELQSGNTLRTSIGVGTGNTPEFTGVHIDSTDTTINRASAGDIQVEGNRIFRVGGTDVPVADGGTGTSSLTDGGILLGSGTGAVSVTDRPTNGQVLVGNASGDPSLESGATLRTSIGMGTGNTPQFTGVDLGGTTSTITADGAGDIKIETKKVYRTDGTDVAIADGGTGISTTPADNAVLWGTGTAYEQRTFVAGTGTTVDTSTAGEVAIDVNLATLTSTIAPVGTPVDGDHLFADVTGGTTTYGWEQPPTAADKAWDGATTASGFAAGTARGTLGFGTGSTISTTIVPNLAASKITSGTLADARIPNLNASKTNAGTFADARIPNLNASKTNAGTFADARIPNLAASKITSGTIDNDRISLTASEIPNLAASKITSGTLADARIPNLNASKTNAGTFADARIPNLAASKTTSGTFADARIPNLNASKITAGTMAVARLPTATESAKGVMQVGTGLDVSSGTVSVDLTEIASQFRFNINGKVLELRSGGSGTGGTLLTSINIGTMISAIDIDDWT